jgi:hypothetical protein
MARVGGSSTQSGTVATAGHLNAHPAGPCGREKAEPVHASEAYIPGGSPEANLAILGTEATLIAIGLISRYVKTIRCRRLALAEAVSAVHVKWQNSRAEARRGVPIHLHRQLCLRSPERSK